MRSRKAQTSMVLLLLVIIIFGMLIMFLMSFSEDFGQEGYLQKYTNNMLLSVVRTDTGYSEERCQTISTVVACSFIWPTFLCNCDNCDDTQISCKELATTRVTYYLERFDMLRENFDYFLKITPRTGVMRDSSGVPIEFEIGNPDVVDAEERFTSEHVIIEGTGDDIYLFTARIYLTRNA